MKNILKNLRLSKKYLLGTSILYFFILFLTIIFVVTIFYLNNLHFELYREETSSLSILYWIAQDFYNLRILSYKHIGTEIVEEMKTYENQSEFVYSRLTNNINKLKNYLKDTPQIQLLEKFQKEFSNYNKVRLKELEWSDLFLKRDAFENANTVGFETFEIAASTLRTLIDRIDKEAEKSYLSFRNISKNSLILLGGFAILLSSLFWIYLRAFSLLIIKPVENFASSIRKISERKEWGEKITVDRKDEIGIMISSFNELSSKIKESTDEIERKNLELQKYSTGLEKLVEEKTEELKKSMLKYYELWRILNEILKISPNAIIITDTKLRINNWNPSAEKIFGYMENELKDKELTVLMEEEEKEKMGRFLIPDYLEPFYTLDSVMLGKNGKRIPCDFFLSPLFDQEKKKIGYVAIMKDLTERKLLEQEVMHVKKMEGIGALAAGIAHDFNNILGAILGYSSYLKSLYDKNEKYYKYVEIIEKSALRGVALTENLQSLYRPSPPKLEAFNLNDVINEITLLLEKSFENILIEKKLSDEPLFMEGDRSQIYHAIINLSVNAKEAMSKDGKIIIKSGEVKKVQKDGAYKNYVYLSVKDTGTGIPDEIKEKIFEPFFTTKASGKGTGLGLTLVSNIVKKHNGFIKVDSEAGNGAEFTLYFPAIEKEEQKIEKIEKIEKSEKIETKLKRATVLVIEDEEDIRELLSDYLPTLGIKVLTASNGEEGLKIYRENMDEISAVILDIHLPTISGFEVHKELRKLKSDLKILWISGIARELKIPLDENSVFLPKPFTIENLSNSLNKLFGI